MKKLLPALLLCFFLFTCKKKDTTVEPAAQTTITGETAIKGSISPADAVITIIITDENKGVHNVAPDGNGIFSIKDLAAGTYNVAYAVSAAYRTQSGQTVTLKAGQTANIGSITFTQGTGSLEGSAAPAGAASKVTVTNTATKASFSAVPDPATGKYKFPALTGGTYTLSYIVTAPSIAPADASVTIGIDKDVVLTPVVFKTPGVTGTVSGTISPSGSANVYIFDPAKNYGFTVNPDLGKFLSPDLLPGTYEISFPAGAPYQSPPKQTITIAQGQSLDLGTIKIPNGLYLIPLTVDGTSFTIGSSAANIKYTAPVLTISASNSSGGLPENKTNNSRISIGLDNLTAPGTYVLQGTATSYMTYQSGSSFSPSKWSLDNGGTATVIITAIDPVKRIITGSFSATLKPGANASSDLVITNGVINVTY